MLDIKSFHISTFFCSLLFPLLPCRAAELLPEACLVTTATLSRHNVTATPSSHSVLFGCTLWFTGPNNDIPVQTAGYASLPPLTSGDPESRTPCGEFLSDVVKDLPKVKAGEASMTLSTLSSKLPTAMLSTASLYSTALPPSNTSRMYYPTSTKSSYKGPRPTFRGSDLSGCLAMTGGSTIFTLQSGDQYPPPVTGEPGVVTKRTTVSMVCSEFLSLDPAPYSLIASFQRNPVCTSYLNWAKENPTVPVTVFPPGVFNNAGYGSWNCSGQCYMEVDSIRVLYFSTKSYRGCSAISSTTSVDTSVTKYAVVDGSTLTYPSMYLAVKGGLTVYDQVGTVGKIHTNPTIAVPPGGLSSLSFLDTLQARPEDGQKTVPYDPGIPSSCVSFEFQHPVTGVETWESTEFFTRKGVMLASTEMFLAPPIQLLTLDPAWKSCIWETDGANHAWTYGIIDPPRLIQTEAEMMGPPSPPPTPTPVSNSSPDAVPSPGATIAPSQPKATADPSPGSSQGAPDVSQQHDPNASDPGSDHGKVDPESNNQLDPGNKNQPDPGNNNQANPGNKNQPDPGSNNQANPGNKNQPDPGSSNQAHPGGYGAPPNTGSGKTVINGQQPTVVNLASAFSTPTLNNEQNSAPSIGNIIYNAFDLAHSSSVNGQDTPAASSASVATLNSTPLSFMTIANHAIAINQASRYISIGTTTLAPGGAGITLSGTPASLDSSYNLILGTPDAKSGSFKTTDASSAAEGIPSGNADPSIGIAPAFAGVMGSSAVDAAPYKSGVTATPADAALATATGNIVTPDPSAFISKTNGSPEETPAISSGTASSLVPASGLTAQHINGVESRINSNTASFSSGTNGFETSSNAAVGTASASFISSSASATRTVQAGHAVVCQMLRTYMKSLMGIELILAMII